MNRRERRAAWLAQHRREMGSGFGVQGSGSGAESVTPSSQNPRVEPITTSQTPSLWLHVDELLLRGFAAVDRHVIGGALQHELTRLFVEQGVPALLSNPAEVKHIDAGSFAIPSGTRANQIGIQVARAVYGGPPR